MAGLNELQAAVQKGDSNGATSILQELLDSGENPKTILDDGLIAAMKIIGEKFTKNEIFVPEMLIAARAMQSALAILEPILTSTGVKSKGTLVVGTVKGDLHDIGKNLVVMMLKGDGWNVVDAGVDVDVNKFLSTAEESGAKFILCSALLTTTMTYMKEIVAAVKAKGSDIKVIVGGAPITEDFANEIGADGFGKDAPQAVNVVASLAG